MRTAIVLEGISDISNTASSGDDVIAGLKQIAARLRAARIRVIVGTLHPSDAGYRAMADAIDLGQL